MRKIMEKKRILSKAVIKPVVQKAWILYFRYEKTQHPVDRDIYLKQRIIAENAIKMGRAIWRKEFQLP